MISDKVTPRHRERKAIFTCVNLRPIRCRTIARAARCNTPCETG